MPLTRSQRSHQQQITCVFSRFPHVLLNAIMTCLTTSDYLVWTRTCHFTYQCRSIASLEVNSCLTEVAFFNTVLTHKRNVFLTGPGGTGKSFLIRRLLRLTEKQGLKCITTATTGLASLSLPHGRTLHSFSGLGKAIMPLNELRQTLQDAEDNNTQPFAQWSQVDILIIDEVSMLSAVLLTKLDTVARHARRAHQTHKAEGPFGGLQLVLVGDFMQLPPVGGRFCFLSPLWKQLQLRIIQLTKVYRQSQDRTFLHLLQRIRLAEHTVEDLYLLRQCHQKYQNVILSGQEKMFRPIALFSHHRLVDKANQIVFDELPGEIVCQTVAMDQVMERRIISPEGFSLRSMLLPSYRLTVDEALVRCGEKLDYRFPRILRFKNQAQYILTFNINTQQQQVNGSRCIFRNSLLYFPNGTTLPLEKTMRSQCFPIPGFPDLVLHRKQMSLRLGYAVTIHSSQGMSLDEALIDLGSTVRRANQAYVALSRVRTLQGLYLIAFDPLSIKAHPAARQFYKSCLASSSSSTTSQLT